MKQKLLFTAMLTAMASTYGVNSVAEQFSIEPSVAQKLMDKIVEQETFLAKINVMPVDELKGEKIFGSVSPLLAKRTNTKVGERQTSDVMELDNKFYELFKTEYDTHITYEKIDAWAKFPDFRDRYAKYVRNAIALSRVNLGWYGTHAAPFTDAVAFPNNEDANKGWLQQLREFRSGAQWFLEGSEDGQIRIGEGGDFPNLDSAVLAALQMIDPIHRKNNDLVAFIGNDLLGAEQAVLYNKQGQTPSEKERIANVLVTKTYANLPVATPTGFPPRGLLITSYENLSIYWQQTSMRRSVMDNPKRDRTEDYQSINEGYIVENEEKAAGFEFANVKIKSGADWV